MYIYRHGIVALPSIVMEGGRMRTRGRERETLRYIHTLHQNTTPLEKPRETQMGRGACEWCVCVSVCVWKGVCFCLRIIEKRDYMYTYIHMPHSIRLYMGNSDWSQRALNIRPAPGKSWFTVGPYEWWEYDYNFVEYNVLSLNLFFLNVDAKACAIETLQTCIMFMHYVETLQTCIMFCLHLARAVLPAISPVAAHQTTSFVNRMVQFVLNWKNADKCVTTKVLVLLYSKRIFTGGLSGPLWVTSRILSL